jgi:hypothetical protein
MPASQRIPPYRFPVLWTARAKSADMAQPVFSQPRLPGLSPSRGIGSAIVAGAAVLGVALLLGALALWFHYGTAVFFEMIASGISACF